jgi:outer membrane protein OmpA-like peptidoglycan-associated protein
LNVGVNLRYNIPVYKEPPFVPVQPMMPKLPEPKAIIPPPPPPPPPPVVMKKVPAEMYITTTTETLLPIIYFENGTDKIIPGYDANLLSLIRKSNLVPSVYVTMGIGDNEGTMDALPKLRASVIEKLIGSKISYHTESLNMGKATRTKEPEIKAECSYAYFKNFDNSYIAKIDTNITQYVEITEDSVYTPVIYYLTNSAPSKYYTDEYVLGFFKFDDESIQHKNYNNISRIINALEVGKRIEIIAYTDDFGTDEYNAKLAMKRAKVTMNEIDKYKKYTKQITLKGEIYKKYDHNNAYERSNNRRVIVRILK